MSFDGREVDELMLVVFCLEHLLRERRERDWRDYSKSFYATSPVGCAAPLADGGGGAAARGTRPTSGRMR